MKYFIYLGHIDLKIARFFGALTADSPCFNLVIFGQCGQVGDVIIFGCLYLFLAMRCGYSLYLSCRQTQYVLRNLSLN